MACLSTLVGDDVSSLLEHLSVFKQVFKRSSSYISTSTKKEGKHILSDLVDLNILGIVSSFIR